MSRISIRDLISIEYDLALKEISDFTRSIVEESGARVVVMGLSGGVDSSVLLAVLTRALPRERVVALIMPDSRSTPKEDVEDAVALAESLGVKYYVVYIDKIVDSYSVAPFVEVGEDLATGNLRARVRMNLLYYYANKYGGLVAGSGDRSELLLGYFTKYGDGAADFLPLGCLYKTQVRELGRRLGLPAKITGKPSAPRLWRGHTAQSELGYDYKDIDLALYALFDLGLSVEEAAEYTGLQRELFEKILAMHRSSRHKRATPLVPRVSPRQSFVVSCK
ncbi:MAG: NAD+ synthase [Desulfurococcaceae archaeon]